MVGAPLEGQHETVVIVPECRGALQVSHLGVGRQLGDRGAHPIGRRGVANAVGAAEQ